MSKSLVEVLGIQDLSQGLVRKHFQLFFVSTSCYPLSVWNCDVSCTDVLGGISLWYREMFTSLSLSIFSSWLDIRHTSMVNTYSDGDHDFDSGV